MVPQQFTQQQIHGCCFRFSTGRAWHGKLWTTRQVARLNKKTLAVTPGRSIPQICMKHVVFTQVHMKTLAQGPGEQQVEQHPSQHKNWIDLMQLLIHWPFTWLVTREDFEVVSQIPYRETSKNTAATSTSKNSSTMDKGCSWMFVFEAVHSFIFNPTPQLLFCVLCEWADTWGAWSCLWVPRPLSRVQRLVGWAKAKVFLPVPAMGSTQGLGIIYTQTSVNIWNPRFEVWMALLKQLYININDVFHRSHVHTWEITPRKKACKSYYTTE